MCGRAGVMTILGVICGLQTNSTGQRTWAKTKWCRLFYNQYYFDRSSLFLFFSGFPGHLFLFYTCDNCQVAKRDNGWRMGNLYFWCKSTKFFRVARKNLFFLYLWNPYFGICFKKLSYCIHMICGLCHQYIFLIACIQPGVVLKSLLIFCQYELYCSHKICFFSKKWLGDSW